MIKRLIDVNDDKVEAVRTLLGTGALKATVDAAFDEVPALDERRRALLVERGVDLLKGWPTRTPAKPRGVEALLSGGHLGTGSPHRA